jgi:hypothetical protein
MIQKKSNKKKRIVVADALPTCAHFGKTTAPQPLTNYSKTSINKLTNCKSYEKLRYKKP